MESLATTGSNSTNTARPASDNAATAKKKKGFIKQKPSSKRNNTKDKKNSKGVKRDSKNDKKIKVLKKGVASIEFDATARYQHLTGFSERKRARRAYGLAQQKIKDRKSKLEHRAAIRTAERDFIEEAEKLKQQHFQLQLQHQQQHGALIINPNDDNNNNQSSAMNKTNEQDTEETVQILFDSEETEQQWGGHVVVTTSTHIPGDSDNDEDDDDDERNNKRKDTTTENHDTEQQYAGNIERYIKTIKGNLPSKKRRTASSVTNNTTSNKRTKGQHGATNMKGVGSAADMKVAQKMLSRSTTRVTKGSIAGRKGRKGGKR
jgi:hypothetical protein